MVLLYTKIANSITKANIKAITFIEKIKIEKDIFIISNSTAITINVNIKFNIFFFKYLFAA